MIVIKLMGGLGNQMQQYALYRKFIQLGKDAYLDTSWFSDEMQKKTDAPRSMEIALFKDVSIKTADEAMIRTLIGGNSIADRIRRKIRHTYFTEEQMYYPDLTDRDGIYLEGYWAAEKYYRNELPILRKEFTFDTDKMSQAAAKMAEKIKDTPSPVSVHIRRGDYLDPENAALFGNIATEEYYKAAFGYIRDKIPDAEFFIFSDDPEYVSAKYGNDQECHTVDVNRGEDNRFDMYLMSLCTSHICANSTFSFWGARLDPTHGSSGISLRPTVQKNTQEFDAKIMRDLWRWWTFIDPSGKIYEA